MNRTLAIAAAVVAGCLALVAVPGSAQAGDHGMSCTIGKWGADACDMPLYRVLPGQRLSVELTEDGGHDVRFVARNGSGGGTPGDTGYHYRGREFHLAWHNDTRDAVDVDLWGDATGATTVHAAGYVRVL